MISEPCNLYAFLHATRGNWRNAVFVECHSCPYGKTEFCAGFLLAPDADGQPIILAADTVREASGQEIDKAECLAVMNRENFESLFSLWLTWWMDSTKDCALFRLAGQSGCRNTR